jgi:hypothetical protein
MALRFQQDDDPRILLSSLKKAEIELLKKIKPKEKELRILIEELKALKLLISQTEKKVHSFKENIEEELEKEILEKTREELESLEQVVRESSKERSKADNDSLNDTYSSISAENILVATNPSTIKELYGLADKEYWTEEDSKTFFNIQYNLKKTITYQTEMNSLFKEQIEDAYKVLQKVQSEQENLIKQHYSPEKNPSNTYSTNNNQQINPLVNTQTYNSKITNSQKKTFETQSSKQNNKSIENKL